MLHKGNPDDRQPFQGAIIVNENNGPIEVFGVYIPSFIDVETGEMFPEAEERIREEVRTVGDLRRLGQLNFYKDEAEQGFSYGSMAPTSVLDEIRSYRYVTTLEKLQKEHREWRQWWENELAEEARERAEMEDADSALLED